LHKTVGKIELNCIKAVKIMVSKSTQAQTSSKLVHYLSDDTFYKRQKPSFIIIAFVKGKKNCNKTDMKSQMMN